MGCCESKPSGTSAGQQNPALSDKDGSRTLLPLAADAGLQEQKSSLAQEMKGSSEDFHLCLPQQETSEFDIHQKSAHGSSSSLDELCGRKNKSEKEQHILKFSAKFFGKKQERESEQIDNFANSVESIPNGKDEVVKNNKTDIDICPIDHVPITEETDIDIYPLDQHEDHLSSGLETKDGSSETQDGCDLTDGSKELTPNSVIMQAEIAALSDNKQSAVCELYRHVLSGNMDVKIPELAKVVRIFTSSTFTDTRVERNALMSKIYPKLREVCQEQGYEFHVVDMRWGVHDPCSDDHRTSEISLKELKACQRLSTGPNFVTFLCQKYGYCPFPHNISMDEFDTLSSVVEDKGDKDLIQSWFVRDENAVPPEYVLQPISSQFPDFIGAVTKESKQQALKDWWDVFLRLQGILRRAAVKSLPIEAGHHYQKSDSEEEIHQGILRAECPNKHAFWFQRIIIDMEDSVRCHNAPLYVDIAESSHKLHGQEETKEWDKGAKELLTSLKEEKMFKVLDKSNIYSYNIKWGENGVDSHSSEEHHQYIDRFCQDFFEKMKSCIEISIKNEKLSTPNDKLFEEVAQHSLQCQQLCSSLHGKSESLEKIKSYIIGQANSPLVVHGQQGSGKTSLLAMAANASSLWVGHEVSVIVRFIGVTLQSSKVHQLLKSLYHQLCVALKVDPKTVPEDYQNLVREFHCLLQSVSASQPLVVFLDSLDNIRSYNISREFAWIPRKLPAHVKIVLSCFTDEMAFSCLKDIVSEEDYFLEIPNLRDDEVKEILTLKLKDSNRKLTETQEEFVLKQVSNCPTPLYLKLVLEQAVQWNSYSIVNEASLGVSVGQVINVLFENLERKHGKKLFQHTVAYISASRGGISETELEDVLSCDDTVLDEVFALWTPHIRRIPASPLSRVKSDIESFLAVHVENGVRLLSWKHRQFYDVVMERYLLSGEKELCRFHSDLADYFIGRWAQGTKKADGKGNAKDRHVARQPLKFRDGVFNYRKLTELPHHLLKCDDFDRLKQSVLCNFEFLLVKLKAYSVHDVIDDFLEALAVKPDEQDIKLVFETLQFSVEALFVSADQLSSQLIGRLSSSRSPSPFIARLLRQAHHPSNPAFIPNIRCLARPGGRLVHSLLGLHGSLVLNQDGSKAMSGSHDQLITLWDVKNGIIEKTLDTSHVIGYVEFCLEDQLAVASCHGVIQFWNLHKGEKVWEISSTDTPAPIAVAGIRDTLVAVLGSAVKVVNLNDGTVTKDFVDQKFLHDRVAGLGDVIAFANSFCSYVRIYDLQATEIRLSIEVCGEDSDDCVKNVILTPFHGGQLIVATGRSCARVFELVSGKCLHVLGPDILYPTVTKSGRHLLCTSSLNDIAIWNLETAVKEKQLLKHPPTTAIERVACVDLKVILTVSDDLMARVWDMEQEGGAEVNFEDNKDVNSIQQLVLIKSSVQKHVITKSKTPGPICVWNTSSCQVIRTLNNTNADEILVVDDTRAVIRSGTRLAIIDLQEGKLIKHVRSDFPAKTEKVHRHASSLYKRRDLALRLAETPRAVTTSLKFSDCALVGSTHVLILSKDRLYVKLASLETGELVTKLKAGQKAVIETVMVSGNGLVAVCSCENAPLLVWDLREKSKRYTLEISGHYPRLTTADLSFNGHYLVDVMKLDKTHKSVVTWDLETGKVKHIIGQGMNVWKVASSSLSMRLLVAGRIATSETLRVYNLVTGEFLHELNGHTEPIEGLSMSKDGKRALSYVPLAVQDRSVRLWDLISGYLLASFTPDLPISSCILTDDGDQVVMVINKSRPIVSLTLSHEVGSRELSVDVSNPYYNHPTLHGAVFDMSNELNWEAENAENEVDV